MILAIKLGVTRICQTEWDCITKTVAAAQACIFLYFPVYINCINKLLSLFLLHKHTNILCKTSNKFGLDIAVTFQMKRPSPNTDSLYNRNYDASCWVCCDSRIIEFKSVVLHVL